MSSKGTFCYWFMLTDKNVLGGLIVYSKAIPLLWRKDTLAVLVVMSNEKGELRTTHVYSTTTLAGLRHNTQSSCDIPD